MPLIPGPVPGESTEQRLARLEKSLKTLSDFAAQALATTSMFQGRPADATLQVPHNDSWLFEDNVDATHPANLRYIISKNVTRVVSARLSIHLAPYRTYNNFSATATGAGTAHAHGNHAHVVTGTHSHTWHLSAGAGSANMQDTGSAIETTGSARDIPTTAVSPGNTDNNGVNAEAAHTHNISVNSTLGVTEGATATGVTLSFDGVLSTLGPYNADVIELDVRSLIQVTQGAYHTVAMQPSGNGRIEAHLRLGVYVAAGQTL